MADEALSDEKKASSAYRLENLLVLLMLGAAIALQVVRRKRGLDDKGPLLLRVLEAVAQLV